MAHGVYLYLFVIDTVLNTITYKPAFKHLTLVNNMDQLIN